VLLPLPQTNEIQEPTTFSNSVSLNDSFSVQKHETNSSKGRRTRDASSHRSSLDGFDAFFWPTAEAEEVEPHPVAFNASDENDYAKRRKECSAG
jgi:hypothetical protein